METFGMFLSVALAAILSFFVSTACPHILGSPDLNVEEGTTIELTCVIKNNPTPPSYIFWYHDDEVINYFSERGGVRISMELDKESTTTKSHLSLLNAQESDSGNYKCVPSNNEELGIVRVHVLATTNGGLPNSEPFI